jgi:hypothetical protein
VPIPQVLPTIPLGVPPVGRRLTEGRAAEAVALLAAAPYQLLAKISQASIVSGHGLVAELRNGPSLYFGGATALPAKWAAATAVISHPGSAGASYIDVTDPSRPVAGADGGTSTGAGASSSQAGSTSPGGATSSATGSSSGLLSGSTGG